MIEYRNQLKTRKMSSLRRFWHIRNPKEYDDEQDTVEQAKENDDNITVRKFYLLCELPTDVKLYILAFVAEVSLDDGSSTTTNSLTRVFPLVSREFRALSKSDCLWQTILERFVDKEPFLWRDGLLMLLGCDHGDTTSQQQQQQDLFSSLSSREVVQLVNSRLREPGYFRLYRMIMARFIRFTSPIFYMSCRRLKIGIPLALHFFEHRHRLLIQTVMEGYPMELQDGRLIANQVSNLPTFVYAHVPPFQQGSRACLVQVHRCGIDPNDGTANVWLMPVAFVKMERVWERADQAGLRYAQCVRLSSSACRELRREETNRHVQRRFRRRRRNRNDAGRQYMPCSIM
jgi:hypothetical protein